MIKNQAGTVKVFAFNRSTGAPVTGDAANITCKYQLNGGSRSAIADTNPTEQEDGFYLFDVTAAETNGITADYYPESSTSGVQVIVVEHNRYTVNSVQLGTSYRWTNNQSGDGFDDVTVEKTP